MSFYASSNTAPSEPCFYSYSNPDAAISIESLYSSPVEYEDNELLPSNLDLSGIDPGLLAGLCQILVASTSGSDVQSASDSVGQHEVCDHDDSGSQGEGLEEGGSSSEAESLLEYMKPDPVDPRIYYYPSCTDAPPDTLDKLRRCAWLQKLLEFSSPVLIKNCGSTRQHHHKAYKFQCLGTRGPKLNLFVCQHPDFLDCDQVTKDSGSMRHHHAAKNHGGTGQMCEKCRTLFSRVDALIRHVKKSCRGKPDERKKEVQTAKAAAKKVKNVKKVKKTGKNTARR